MNSTFHEPHQSAVALGIEEVGSCFIRELNNVP